MIGPSDRLRVVAEAARVAAARVLRDPSLFSVLVDLGQTTSGPKPVTLRFGFQQVRRGLMMGDTLKTCWVDVAFDPSSVVTGSVGTFGRQQFKQLASIQGMAFPPQHLDLDSLHLEVVDVLRFLEDQPFGPGPGLGRVDLSLFHYDGRLAWRALQEVPGVGFRTRFLDAEDGRVLFEKVDAWCEPGTANR